MGHAKPTEILSHWNNRIEGMQQSSQEFYGEVERVLLTHNLKDVKAERVSIAEGGLFSSKREYLQLKRGEHVFHVCAAPYGSGFFVSWWLGRIESGLWAAIAELPVIGLLASRFLKPITYYKLDTAMMFQSVIHQAVLAVLDGLTNEKGIRALSESERKPVMRDFFARIGAS